MGAPIYSAELHGAYGMTLSYRVFTRVRIGGGTQKLGKHHKDVAMHSNPWKSIWLSPRATIASVVAENPNRSIWWLASIYGFSSLLSTFQSLMLGIQLNLMGIFILAIVLAPFWGYAMFSIWSWVIYLTGKWFKGTASFKVARAAYAWSCVPLIANIPIWFVLAAIFGPQLFTNFSENYLLTNGQVTTLFGILIIRIAAAVWSLVIYLNALAEVQQYSILRAIGNVLVAGLIFAAAAYLFLVLFFGTLGAIN